MAVSSCAKPERVESALGRVRIEWLLIRRRLVGDKDPGLRDSTAEFLTWGFPVCADNRATMGDLPCPAGRPLQPTGLEHVLSGGCCFLLVGHRKELGRRCLVGHEDPQHWVDQDLASGQD